MNSYELSRKFVDYSFENPSKIKPNHYALYFFSIEHCNRLGWKKEFGLPTTMTMEAIGIRSYNTYSKTFNELIEFGFFNLIERSTNQYSANIIGLSNFNKALDKALDKAFIKHATKQEESTQQSIDSIDKPINNKTINNKTINKEFEKFWNLYNKKKGSKKKCENKFNSLSNEDKEQIFITLPNFLKSVKDKKYLPFPHTYLNNERWNDELESNVKKGWSINNY